MEQLLLIIFATPSLLSTNADPLLGGPLPAEHRRVGRAAKCLSSECCRRPTFGVPNGTAIFCGQHKGPGHIDVVNPVCAAEGCMVRGSIAAKERGTESRLYCRRHVPSVLPSGLAVGYRRSRSRATTGLQCQWSHLDLNCTREAIFGHIGIREAAYCNLHKEDGMVKVPMLCRIVPDCSRHATFRLPGHELAEACRVHRNDSHRSIHSAVCEVDDCEKVASYGQAGCAVRCARHRRISDHDCKHARCLADSCRTSATFSTFSGVRNIYCAEHRTMDHVNQNERKAVIKLWLGSLPPTRRRKVMNLMQRQLLNNSFVEGEIRNLGYLPLSDVGTSKGRPRPTHKSRFPKVHSLWT